MKMLPKSWTTSVSSYLSKTDRQMDRKGRMGAGPLEAVGIGPRHNQQHLPVTARYPTSTWGVEIVYVESRFAHNSRHFQEL